MADEDGGEFEPVTIGERLRRAREERGMSLDDVANRTRIPIRHLQHIESEDWDALPAATYAIGFSRNYANAVGLDGAAIGNELREAIGGPRRRAPAPEYYEPADPARVPPRSLAIIAGIIAIALIVAYLIWRGTLADEIEIPVLDVPAAQAPAPAPAPGPAPAAATGQAVALTATGEVWLRVTDGPGGPSLFMGSVNAGQTIPIPAAARHPVIRTGRPQLLRVSVGGRDLGPLAPEERTIDNVSLLPQDLAAGPRPAAVPPARATTLAPPAGPAPPQ